MDKYKKYEKYKDSGVEWMGEVPEEWDNNKLKYIINTTKGFAFKSEVFKDHGIPIIKTTDIKQGRIQKTITYIDEELKDNFNAVSLIENDILLSTVGSKPEVINSAVGQIGKVQKEYVGALLNQNAVILRISDKNISNEYIFYFISSNNYRKYLDLYAHGTANQASLSLKEILNFELYLPDLNVQTQIANFLDQKTSEIDSLIDDKENLINLLEEKRQAITTEAITEGLNPNYKMKDSEVDWIGKIPEQWSISKIKYQADINMKALSENTDEDSEIKYIDIGSVNSNGEVINIENYIFKNSPSRARRILSTGDTIVSTVRTYLKAITWFEDVKENIICSTGFVVLSPRSTIYAKYLFYLMRSTMYIDEIVRRSTGVSYPAISSSDIGKIECLLPNKEEQVEIVKYIDKQIGEISGLVESITLQIEKLKEYRQSLISEAITGKIDVRKYYEEG